MPVTSDWKSDVVKPTYIPKNPFLEEIFGRFKGESLLII